MTDADRIAYLEAKLAAAGARGVEAAEGHKELDALEVEPRDASLAQRINNLNAYYVQRLTRLQQELDECRKSGK